MGAWVYLHHRRIGDQSILLASVSVGSYRVVGSRATCLSVRRLPGQSPAFMDYKPRTSRIVHPQPRSPFQHQRTCSHRHYEQRIFRLWKRRFHQYHPGIERQVLQFRSLSWLLCPRGPLRTAARIWSGRSGCTMVS